MDAETCRLVRERAGDRFEYCRLPQSAIPFLNFHVEHIVAKQHLSDDSVDNLALACPFCNRYKGPNLTAWDETLQQPIRLFHPCQDRWDEHFDIGKGVITGLTPVGVATIRLLRMNEVRRIELRFETS